MNETEVLNTEIRPNELKVQHDEAPIDISISKINTEDKDDDELDVAENKDEVEAEKEGGDDNAEDVKAEEE